MPWKGKGCQVEVDELELIVAPCPGVDSTAGDETCSSQDDKQYMHCTSGKFGHEMADNMAKSALSDVHEGVKTIAKIVKWFLTSFNVKINKLIIAFDPYLEKDDKEVECERMLVLRIMEIECGTGVSEDDESKLGSFLGISQLTNFLKFRGAIIELLHMDKVNDQTCCSCASGATFGSLFLCSCSSNIATSVLIGEKGGFSGSLRLSIPWKNGSLDIRKVDADIYVDPIELRFQPSTIKWFLLSWEIYRSLGKGARGPNHTTLIESDFLNGDSHVSSTLISSAIIPDNMIPIRGSVPSNFSCVAQKQTSFEDMLPGSHFIHDWVPFPASESEKDSIGGELDLAASVDQFFECFDGLTNSQSALGGSGMWNWTCSVFSAITAASSLASGSLHIPSDQQHVQTNLKATFAGLCITLLFDDEDHKLLCDKKGNQMNNCPNLHYMGAECRDIHVGLQVCPQEMRVEGTIKCIEVSDYLCNKNDVTKSSLDGCVHDFQSQTHLIQNLQAKVQGSLPPVVLFAEDSSSEKLSGLVAADFPFGNKGGITKVMLLKTSGFTHYRFNMNLNPSDGNLRCPATFSLELPPFIFWVNFWLINALLNLLKEVAKCVDVKDENNKFPVEPSGEKHRSTQDTEKGGPCPGVKASSSIESLRGEISLLNSRIILCFPFESPNHLASYSSWDQYIALDFRSLSTVKKGTIEDNSSISGAISQKKFTPRATQSLHLIISSLDVYLVTSACSGNAGIDSCDVGSLKFCAEHVISTTSRAGSFSVISMLWRDSPITGPWIVERAKSLATSDECISTEKFMGKGYEFATVTPVKDMEGKHAQIRNEIVSSSAFLLHIHLFSMRINLGAAQYNGLNRLLDQMVNASKCFACDSTSTNTEISVSQTAILVECDSVEITIRPDIKKNVKSSLQNELPGSWHHLKLKIQKLSLLSVTNIGAIRGATFFWLAHGKGNLWGSITEVPDQEFLLISCSNSTMKRGDGGGSNALSSSLAGSDILHLWEPENCNIFTSVTVRCVLFVAVGGRLDWFYSISSFFILPSPEVEDSDGNSSQKCESSAHNESSFVLKLVDVGLSYEPYLKKLVIRGDLSSSSFKEEMDDPVGCLLAASLLTISNTTFSDSINNDYMVRVQDLGLLIGAMSESTNIDGNYSMGHLRRIGYIRVAREALIEVIFRTNSKNGLLWEIECSKSHIYLETCHDTTSGLLCLVAQLQQLFAPDVEESLVHLQSRWNNFQQVEETNEYNDESRILNRDVAPSVSLMHTSTVDFEGRSGVCGLMDEICENAFHFDHVNESCDIDFSESQGRASLDENLLGEACSLTGTPEISCDGLSFNESMPLIGLESNGASFLEEGYIPEVMEGYCLSELRSLSELSVGRQSFPEVLICRSRSLGDGDAGIRNGGWYGDSSLKIVENHISDTNGEARLKDFLDDKYRPDDCTKHADSKEATGRVLFNNVNVIWRMYAGSDWHESRKNKGSSVHLHGRDTTACLELTLSGMRIQYDTFPGGGTCVSKLSLSVQDFYLSDMSKAAPWKLVLGYYNSKDHPRESSSKAFKLELEAVRPDPIIPLEEYRLCIAFLPLLLHLHQSQLDFLINFFAKSSSFDQSLDSHQDAGGSKISATSGGHAIPDEALLPFFQKFDIYPILVRVDYRPSHVDLAALRGGKYVELVNLIPWKGIELQLKHVHAVGLYGWGSICETIIGDWLEDISQNQVHKVLQGIPTVRSLVAVGAGASKLVSLPVENYRKDRRVLKGMQRGTIAFLRSISLEAVGLGVHLAAGAHEILLLAECILTSIPPSVSWPAQDKRKTNVRCNQPKNAQQGIHLAYESLNDGLEKSASALVRTPLKRYQRGASAGSAFATAVRGVPAAAIAPASACASAVRYALLGLRNSLDPEHKKESLEKYLGPSHLRE
ncbi:autophagy-related protein 2-like isoform X2 [Tripterygium wilfordii]|nr:autophagy-related protein 2-like isoform X2 [Tripterygium wilfordii]